MSKRLYNYEIVALPVKVSETAVGKPVGFKTRIYNVKDQRAALRIYVKTQLKWLRKNGLRGPAKDLDVIVVRISKNGNPR